jgi:hypothetical protein
MRHHRLLLLAVLVVAAACWPLYAQDTLSAQVLRLLTRTNTWSGVNTFTEDPLFAEVHTAAPAGGDCDEAAEIGKIWWDSTNFNLYLCAGSWRKFTSVAP